MPDGLYERDALAWAERQAGLLRRLAAGEKVNAEVDWANVIEEVQDVGLSELRAVESLLRQAMVHLMKLRAWPQSLAAGHWRGEAIGFLADASRQFSPSMRQRIDLERGFRAARRQIAGMRDDSGSPEAIRETCPWSLDELMADEPEPAALAAKLA